MIHYNAQSLSKKLAYKLLSGSIIPRPIAWVTTINQTNQVVNAAPFSFFNGVASDLPLVSLAILRKEGASKDTAVNILANKELVIHLITEEVVDEMNQTAANFEPDVSEIEITQLETIPSQTVQVPSIKKAKIRMEAQLHQYIPIKNENDEVITDMFIVKITDFFFDPAVFDQEKEYILAEKFRPVARLSGNAYTTVDNSFQLTRPQ